MPLRDAQGRFMSAYAGVNIADITQFLTDFIDSFDFTRPGIDQSLGRDCAMKVVDQIQNRAADDQAGAQGVWLANEPDYATWKEKRYNISDNEPNVRTGQMLSQKSLYGRTTIMPREVTMIYGVGEKPSATRSGALPVRLKGPRKGEPLDDKTDVEKAYFAHTGQGPHGVKRPFYQVNDDDGIAVAALCQDNLNDLIRETNAKNGY